MAPDEDQQQQHHDAPPSPRQATVAADSTPKLSAASTTAVVQQQPVSPSNGSGNGSETPKSKTATAHDSMVTVRLSEPPAMSIDAAVPSSPTPSMPVNEPPSPSTGTASTASSAPASDMEDGADDDDEHDSPSDDEKHPADHKDVRASTASTVAPGTTLHDELGAGGAEEEEQEEDDNEDDNDFDKDEDDEDTEEVNWEKLEQTEDAQAKDEDTDNQSTTLLLQRLEQENAKLATNPKTAKVKAAEEQAAAAAGASSTSSSSPSNSTASTSTAPKPRTPSMAQLRQMVRGPAHPNLRYSMLPPPPMTDLEFWGALVKDYQQTAARLPTLLSNKIHKGIPPPLRGVVWQSMSGARDGALEEQYDRLSGESSPYEMLIGKDLGRSFPGVEMFRDPEGDGQRMLGRVLKAFSLYDTKIGYCQGLAFLVGPLLMHMPDKQAFCVLVRLMERYDLRTCFLPDLSGLHVRIFQFRELLKSNLPMLSAHFDELQVDPAYVSQWFLSFFAVTCPLPMLFRIYDVIFAEGASETLMRVALSLMRKNEARLLACTELEDVLQLLLSRGLWDCYHYDADMFVDDFVSLTSEVSRENLSQLERGYRESLIAAANTARTSDISRAATRFLGRIWAASSGKPSTLSPSPGPSSSKPLLRRSTSKQSLASTLNSVEASSASVASSVSTSTDASTVSRDSSNTGDESSSRESTPVGPKGGTRARAGSNTKAMGDRYLHSQIEDLLTAMTELQRNQAALANQLQREREEREEDHEVVRPLLNAIKEKTTQRSAARSSDDSAEEGGEEEQEEDDGWASMTELVSQAEARLGQDSKSRRQSMLQHSKAELREELTQVRDQLASSMALSQDFNRKVHELDSEVSSLKEQLRQSQAHMRSMNQDRQRLEKKVQTMRSGAAAAGGSSSSGSQQQYGADQGSLTGSPSSIKLNTGLRELKLARSKSSPSQAGAAGGAFGKRLSSLSSLPARRESAISMTSVGTSPRTPVSPSHPHHELTVPASTSAGSLVSSSSGISLGGEQDILLVELAQSKTAEAVARQEAEEAKQKLEALKRAYGLSHHGPGQGHSGDATHTPPPSTPSEGPGAGMTAAMGLFGRLTGQMPGSAATTPPATAGGPSTASPAGAGAAGGFWGWRR